MERGRPTSPNLARDQSIVLARYSVVPDDTLAGTERTFTRDDEESADRVVFFVTSAEFAIFSDELSRLADGRPSVHSEWTYAEVARLAVTRFLSGRVLQSPHIDKYDLKMLGR